VLRTVLLLLGLPWSVIARKQSRWRTTSPQDKVR